LLQNYLTVIVSISITLINSKLNCTHLKFKVKNRNIFLKPTLSHRSWVNIAPHLWSN
jgi:hypothetical protein